MNKNVVLFRGIQDPNMEDEVHAMMRSGVNYKASRVETFGATVFARYSALPFYQELEYDLADNQSKLINSYRQHRFVANVLEYSEVLGKLTPRTRSWSDFAEYNVSAMSRAAFPVNGVVVKGETNSKKFLWNTHMFAADYKAAVDVMVKLRDDGLVGQQEICVREYVPLKKLADGFHGLPISEEYRVFVLGNKEVCRGFYWSQYAEDVEHNAASIPQSFIDNVIARIGSRCNFYAIDIARTEDNNWIVIELNDGQMSGLSECDPYKLYCAIDGYQSIT